MTETTLKLQNFVDRYILSPWDHFRVVDILDWILLTLLFYCIYLLCRGRVAARVTAGVLIMWGLFLFAEQVELVGVHRLIEGIAPVTVVLLAVIYQQEMRDALARIGSMGLGKSSRVGRAVTANTIHAVVEAACEIAEQKKDGALIVIELFDNVDEHTDKGYPINAEVTRELLCSIFRDRTPFHDGAVIIRHNLVALASSKLPLRKNSEIVKGMGTRHRAAVGITDVTDCVVVVVSEETHIISVANHGRILRDFNKGAEDLQDPEKRKEVVRKLRKTLSYLLLGLDMEAPKELKKKKKENPIEIRIKLGFNLDREDRERIRKEREDEKAAQEKFRREYHKRYKNMPTPDQFADRVALEYGPEEQEPFSEDPSHSDAPSDTATPKVDARDAETSDSSADSDGDED